jgi:serine/threonine protein kinase
VKVLDFGLAKAMDPATGASQRVVVADDHVAAMTRAGMILGTAAYMSPEQARGRQVDRRADIWGVRRRAVRDADRKASVSRRRALGRPRQCPLAGSRLGRASRDATASNAWNS